MLLFHILLSFAAPLVDDSVLFMPFQSSLRLSRAWVHLSPALFILLFLVAFAVLGIPSCSKGQDIISVGFDQIIIHSLRTVGWLVGPALTGRSSTFISTFFSSISIFALSFSSHSNVKWPATYLGSLFEVHGWLGGPMHRLPGLLSFSVSTSGSFSSQLKSSHGVLRCGIWLSLPVNFVSPILQSPKGFSPLKMERASTFPDTRAHPKTFLSSLLMLVSATLALTYEYASWSQGAESLGFTSFLFIGRLILQGLECL
ncbi:hypothetical protein IWZ03DRAFT_233405 [Phyllosticta citriasiana]|uniref:Uncharacterized protein n=1 Tax=Phyllosticta citriasiana TaxID=595635 RepID=A0ABR1KHQ3_9PEZI